MRFFPMAGWMGVALAVIGSCFLYAQATPDSKWQELRGKQPPALHLKLTLPKTEFFQGEQIDATLDYSNDDPKISCLVGSYYGTLDEPPAIFHALDEKGNAAPDPLKWYHPLFPPLFDWARILHDLTKGPYTLTLPVNDTVRFDQPGVYVLYAESASLVSQKITITITSLSADKEKQIITGVLQKIGADGSSARKEISELGYLQTPAARAALISLLDPSRHAPLDWVKEGLFAAPDPTVEAAQILAEVQAEKLNMDEHGVKLYGELKLFHVLAVEDRGEVERVARQEVIDATKDLWMAFEESRGKNRGDPDSDGGKARAALAAHQLKLPANHVKELMDNWDKWGSSDFLPLVRREAGPPTNNINALIALVGIKPDEARPRIIEEFQRPNSRFWEDNYPASTFLPSVQPMPLPQFDSLFRSKLREGKLPASIIISVIGCFGSPVLLPDVLDFYRKNGSTWNDTIKAGLFLYWLRCDPKSAIPALEQEIQTHANGDGWDLLGPFNYLPWTDDELPIALWALKGSDPNLAYGGIVLVLAHGDEMSLDPAISTLERLGPGSDTTHYVRQFLKSTRWHYTDEQRKRLETLAGGSH